MKLNRILLPFLFLAALTVKADSNYTTPNMNLTIPVPGQESGPAWANDINASLTLIDAHNHSPGNGVQITPTGLNINTNLTFNGNFVTNLGGGFFSVQVADPSKNSSIYSKGVDLYYKDGNGNVVQITSGGGVAGTPGSISNLTSPASASYVAASGTFVWQQNVATAANMDSATLVLRYPGSYPAPTGNYIAIQAPTTLATGFAYTLPAALPGTAGAFLTSSTSGQISYTNVDNSTLSISGSTLQVPTHGITQTQHAVRVTGTTATAGNVAVGVSMSPTLLASAAPGSYALLVNLATVTLTTLGSPVQVFVQSTAGDGIISCAGSGSNQCVLAVYRNGSPTGFYVPMNGGAITAPYISFVDSVSAGTYTYQLYGTNNSGAATLSATHIRFVAYEL